jgi:hypothetical protein
MTRRLAGCAVMLVLGCENSPPTTPSLSSSPSSIVSIRVNGPDTIAPGETMHLEVTGVRSDGSTSNVTATSAFRIASQTTQGVLSGGASGVFVGGVPGEASIQAVNQGGLNASTGHGDSAWHLPPRRLHLYVNNSPSPWRGHGKMLAWCTALNHRFELQRQ